MVDIEIPIAGALPVRASWFAARGASAGAIVLAPALSTPRAFYRGFAEFLVEQGYAALSFDYRGIETGAVREVRASDTDMETWLRVDVSAAIDEAAARSGGAPVYLVGHSLGGMALGATPSASRLAAAVTIASGNGYPGLNPRSGKALWFLGNVALPLYTRLFGYFPGRRIHKVGNLPRGVALQWSRWLKRRDYWFADPDYDMAERFAQVRCPVLSVSFADDRALQRPAIDDLHARYANAPVTRWHLAPGQLALEGVGHFGFFKRASAAALWHPVLRWLRSGNSGGNGGGNASRALGASYA
jgi:predicted alpha/beta hydrolase